MAWRDVGQFGFTAAMGLCLLTAVMALTGASVTVSEASARKYKPKQIRIEYTQPKNPAHNHIYERIKEARVLERIQELLSPLRLPRPLPLKVAGCDGVSNAWYDAGVVTVCYEYLDDILKNAPKKPLPVGITPEDAIVGPLLDVFLHEVGHAVFDLLEVPILGREEDAADAFSALIMLQFNKADARKLILGSAYQYRSDLQKPQVSIALRSFADEHGLPAQRFFNTLCFAYGSDPKLFADLLELGYLPKARSEGCEAEYEQALFGFRKLIGPYFDKRLVRKVLKTWMRDVNARPRRSTKEPVRGHSGKEK
jgi:hypothetical protein